MSTALVGRSTLGARATTIALVALVGVLLFPFASGIMGAGILYVIAEPLLRKLERVRMRRVGAMSVVMLLFVVLVVPGVVLLTQLLAQGPAAIQNIQQSRAFQQLMLLRIGSLDVGAQLQEATADVVRWGSRQTLAVLGGLVSATVNLVIALFGCYYLLMSGGRWWESSKRILPFEPATSEALRVRFHRATEAMLLGVVLAGATQGTLVGVAFTIAGLGQPLFWGGVTAACSVLPMFGSALVWLPASLVLAAQERTFAAVAMLTFGVLVVSNIDNALRLVVYRRVSHIHPMITLVGAFAGVQMFGLAGLLIGPLVLSYAIELLSVTHFTGAFVEARAA